MSKHHAIDDLNTACGLKITDGRRKRGQVSSDLADVDCAICNPTVVQYTSALELATNIFHKNFEFLMDCKVQTIGGGEIRDAKVYFNKVSKTKKHVVLVKDGKFWRRRDETEVALDEGIKINEKFVKKEAEIAPA